jgi:hypothetical protein
MEEELKWRCKISRVEQEFVSTSRQAIRVRKLRSGTGTELGCTRPNSLLVAFAQERVSPRPQLQPSKLRTVCRSSKSKSTPLLINLKCRHLAPEVTLPTSPNVTRMSSSSNARGSSRAERRTTTDNGSTQPRDSSGQQGGRSERPDPRRAQSPQPSTSGQSHKRTTSGLQRTNRGVDERRTERVQVTTRETLTSRPRSPERRPGPSVQPPERPRQAEPNRTHSGDPRPRAPKSEVPQGIISFLETILVSI